jgi:arylsulfatase A-like enzyme
LDPDELKGKLPAYMPDVPEIREDMADYLGECQVTDRYLQEYLDVLEEQGLLENTLVIATGDNGIPGFPRGKMNCYNSGIQQGMLVHWPAGITSAGLELEDFVSFIDLAPTFCDVAGIRIPGEMRGRSMLPLFSASESGLVDPSRDHIIAGRERHDMDAREGKLPYPTRVWRDKDYLFMMNFKPDRWPNSALPELATGDTDQGPTVDFYRSVSADPSFQEYVQLSYGKRPRLELYHIKKDPDCLVNLALDPAFAGLREEYEKKLLEQLRELGDRRVTGDGSAFDQPPFTLPYTHVHQKK